MISNTFVTEIWVFGVVQYYEECWCYFVCESGCFVYIKSILGCFFATLSLRVSVGALGMARWSRKLLELGWNRAGSWCSWDGRLFVWWKKMVRVCLREFVCVCRNELVKCVGERERFGWSKGGRGRREVGCVGWCVILVRLC